MKYFQSNGEVYAFEDDGSQDEYIPANSSQLTESEALAITSRPAFIENVSPRQIRMALTRSNLRQQVEDAVAAGSQDLKDWWNYSTTFERNNPQVEAMATAVGVTPEAVDQLWILAATL